MTTILPLSILDIQDIKDQIKEATPGPYEIHPEAGKYLLTNGKDVVATCHREEDAFLLQQASRFFPYALDAVELACNKNRILKPWQIRALKRLPRSGRWKDFRVMRGSLRRIYRELQDRGLVCMGKGLRTEDSCRLTKIGMTLNLGDEANG